MNETQTPTDSHTIVIPTYNRPELLAGLLTYYHARASWIRLLILDSSRDEIKQQNATMMSQLGDAVSHIIYREDINTTTKLINGLASVSTQYVSFCADDDLVFPLGLRKSISFLQENPGYVCAHGLYLNFRTERRDIRLTGEYASPSIEAENSGARIFQLCQKYESLFYAVYRTADARQIFPALESIETAHFQELFQSVASVIHGKIKRLPLFYGARRTGPPADAAREKWQTYAWFADNPAEFLDHYRQYREATWLYCQTSMRDPQWSQEDFYRILDLSHAVYFSAACPADYFFSQLQHLWPRDTYGRFGRLDTLTEAGKMIMLKRLLLPGKDEPMDALDQLRLASDVRCWADSGLFGGTIYLYQSSRGYAKLFQMNFRANVSVVDRWRCRLPKTLNWLAANAQFQDAYTQLCHYLGKAPK